jgi:dolichol-phosphate mannosyltransferase
MPQDQRESGGTLTHLGGAEHERTTAPPEPTLSIVIPTRNEAGNIAPLVERLERALPSSSVELIFVDDSDDGTDAVVSELVPAEQWDVRLVHREPPLRRGGLGGAVVEGLRVARATWVCVMDADLQHPPELIPALEQRAARGDADVIVASRFCLDGHADEFGRARRAISYASTHVAHLLFARQLRAVTDPMSGFFLVRRAAIDVDALRPQGFKILLEILVRTGTLRPAEVPFDFGVRHSGESKASVMEGARYLRLLWRLRLRSITERFGRFGVVGLSGLIVNTGVLALMADVIGMWYVAGAIVATQVSTLWNFVLTDRWVFDGGSPRFGRGRRAATFFAMNNAALLLRIPTLYVLVTGLGMHHLLANILTLVALTLLRFGVADAYIWSRNPSTMRTFHYDIHGIVTLVSDAPLPELERFRVDDGIADPLIRVRLEPVRSRGIGSVLLDSGATKVHYVEGPGGLGFATEIELGERIDIVAAPLLGRSPHVLYTNIVEPVLRWTFVERGYALVHAACMASDDRALLITARTDTGKTTTALKLLDSRPYSFLSDDLTLLSPDGRVLAYPKPLTISRHTLSAVKSHLLRRRERMGLTLQSRVHSRSGRLFALVIAKTRLPAATINALVQFVIPPPKFQVDRLVPGVAIAPEAQLAGMAIIRREGDEGTERLPSDEALDILLSNCEDAYGFPPYPVIKQWLCCRNGEDLQSRERDIIRAALAGKPTHLLSSYERRWFEMLPAVIETLQPTTPHGGESIAATA